jgi:hypothetical protein
MLLQTLVPNNTCMFEKGSYLAVLVKGIVNKTSDPAFYISEIDTTCSADGSTLDFYIV